MAQNARWIRSATVICRHTTAGRRRLFSSTAGAAATTENVRTGDCIEQALLRLQRQQAEATSRWESVYSKLTSAQKFINSPAAAAVAATSSSSSSSSSSPAAVTDIKGQLYEMPSSFDPQDVLPPLPACPSGSLSTAVARHPYGTKTAAQLEAEALEQEQRSRRDELMTFIMKTSDVNALCNLMVSFVDREYQSASATARKDKSDDDTSDADDLLTNYVLDERVVATMLKQLRRFGLNGVDGQPPSTENSMSLWAWSLLRHKVLHPLAVNSAPIAGSTGLDTTRRRVSIVDIVPAKEGEVSKYGPDAYISNGLPNEDSDPLPQLGSAAATRTLASPPSLAVKQQIISRYLELFGSGHVHAELLEELLSIAKAYHRHRIDELARMPMILPPPLPSEKPVDTPEFGESQEHHHHLERNEGISGPRLIDSRIVIDRVAWQSLLQSTESVMADMERFGVQLEPKAAEALRHIGRILAPRLKPIYGPGIDYWSRNWQERIMAGDSSSLITKSF
ncbi:hypothetical protein GQ42DRAFT_27729 [Ramicandelaber brevisporus]|nr:hypothetical protein GQ42DRAFT_27729 [Ramicandelaber brevisporus]